MMTFDIVDMNAFGTTVSQIKNAILNKISKEILF
jgi:hypothetical protein